MCIRDSRSTSLTCRAPGVLCQRSGNTSLASLTCRAPDALCRRLRRTALICRAPGILCKLPRRTVSAKTCIMFGRVMHQSSTTWLANATARLACVSWGAGQACGRGKIEHALKTLRRNSGNLPFPMGCIRKVTCLGPVSGNVKVQSFLA